MGLIYHGQIGRGLSSFSGGKTTLQTAYDNLKGGTVEGVNVAANAGLPESFISWYAGEYGFSGFYGPHSHKDGSLAPKSIGLLQLDMVGTKQVQFVRTPQGTGILCISGFCGAAFSHDNGYERTVSFGEGSTIGASFPYGTIPTVLLTPIVFSSAFHTGSVSPRMQLLLREVTSQYFTYRYETDITVGSSMGSLGVSMSYVAFGRAPGEITRVVGV